jgi:hypothetical protein
MKNSLAFTAVSRRAATAAVFDELKVEEAVLAERLAAVAPPPAVSDPEAEVAAALTVLGRLAELADGSDADGPAITE